MRRPARSPARGPRRSGSGPPPPRMSFPVFPALIIRPRQRMSACRDKDPTTRSGTAVPRPNATMTEATLARSRPWAARTEAAPSVGPTQGLQTAPSSKPSTNWPPRPVGVSRWIRRFPVLLTPDVATAKRCCSASLSSTAPMMPSSTAEMLRNTSPSSPAEKPMVATNRPTPTNDVTSPAANAATPRR